MNELTLQGLKDQADLLEISYHPNIGIEALRQKIQAKLAEADKVPDSRRGEVGLTKEQVEMALRAQLQQDQMKLVRIRVTNLNPAKKNLPGEIVTVGNRFLGSVRKYIPFGEGTDNGYHVPFCIYQYLKEKRFSQVKTRKGENGQLLPEAKLVPEYALEVLEPLSAKELTNLAHQQAAAGGL